MGQMTNKMDKLREYVYEHPDKSPPVREIAKKTKVPKSTVQKYLKEIRKEQEKNPELHTIKKITYYIEKLFFTRTIQYLEKELKSSVIVLYGSFRKGEYDSESDIDLFVETTSPKKTDLSKYEQKLGHKIHLLTKTDIKKVPERLRNNIINGIKLSGYLKI
ncbi:hypothetical protein GF358_01415 [Candidatus Woesearchaeota archaeon]|nr:hypothetical protein [Candidatus Woesearchaeota archaeon]